ncbi:MAG: GldG family protein [Thiohalocapsa sp.]|nr:GldG family protein [Thiohalocapsa sp.]
MIEPSGTDTPRTHALPADASPDRAPRVGGGEPPDPECAPPRPKLPAGVPRIDGARVARIGADTVFSLLLIAVVLLAGWLAGRHDRYWDWTASARNSLSPESVQVLGSLDGPIGITVYAPPDHRIGRAVEELLVRYRKHLPTLGVDYVDPQRFPERARDADVRLLGQLVVSYDGRRETLLALSESTLTNAIARLAQPRSPWIAVLEGHGERAIDSSAGTDIGRFAQLLQQRGFRLQPLDLARLPVIPDNTDLLLITTPSIALFPGEADALVDYVNSGGSLLWLRDPSDDFGLAPLAAALGIRALPGQVVDAEASGLGLDAPTFAIVEQWPGHPIGRGMNQAAVLPGSLAFEVHSAAGWLLDTTLTTGKLSWNETGPIHGEIQRDERAGEVPGPLPVAMALTRTLEQPRYGAARSANPIEPDRDSDREPDQDDDGPLDDSPAGHMQRVLVFGDGDFLSNAHLATGANQALSLRAVRWLTGQEDRISVPPPPEDTDNVLLSAPRSWALVLVGLLGLPLGLLAAGLAIQWQRGRT